MTAYLSPVLQQNQFSNDDTFLAGGLIWFYQAGTSTELLAYQDTDGLVPWPNPIQLNARGETGGTIWLTSGQPYKMVLESKPFYGQVHGPVIADYDNITGVNDPENITFGTSWIVYPGIPQELTSTSFSVIGDQTNIFQSNRRLLTTNNAGVIPGSVSSASYNGSSTTVNVINDFGALDSGLSSVSYSIAETSPSSVPYAVLHGTPSSISTSNLFLNYNGSHLDAYGISALLGTIPFFSDFESVAANSGYQKLPGGLIIQWGSTLLNASTPVPVVYPTPYTSGVYHISGAYSGTTGGTWDPLTFDKTNAGGSPANPLTGFCVIGTNTKNLMWIAIGK